MRKRQARSVQYNSIQEVEEEGQTVLRPFNERKVAEQEKLDARQTARLGFEFGLIWVQFSSNRRLEAKLTNIVCGIVIGPP